MTAHGTTAARNALSNPCSSPEVRTAARDLLFAANARETRVLTDQDLAEWADDMDRGMFMLVWFGLGMGIFLALMISSLVIVTAMKWAGWW